jgi:hypothetical protein
MPDDAAPESELDRLDPQTVLCEFTTGFTVEVVRMRTRQFFRLLRILTHGAGPAMMQAGLNFQAEGREFVTQLLTLVVMSIPDAESEAVQFLASMCKPAGLVEREGAPLNKQESEANAELWKRHGEELHNPDLEDTIDLIELIIRQEAPELQALGKKLEKTLKLFQRTGQDKDKPEPEASPEELASQEPSPRHSTSSATSTDGLTSTSSPSPSAASGRSSKRRQPAASATT